MMSNSGEDVHCDTSEDCCEGYDYVSSWARQEKQWSTQLVPQRLPPYSTKIYVAVSRTGDWTALPRYHEP